MIIEHGSAACGKRRPRNSETLVVIPVEIRVERLPPAAGSNPARSTNRASIKFTHPFRLLANFLENSMRGFKKID